MLVDGQKDFRSENGTLVASAGNEKSRPFERLLNIVKNGRISPIYSLVSW